MPSRSRTAPGQREHVVRVQAVATPGLLLRFAAVLNPHPVSEFIFLDRSDGTVTLTVRLDEDACDPAGWHLRRVVVRLRRLVGVTSAREVGLQATPHGLASAQDGGR
jgi:hypothetical protein